MNWFQSIPASFFEGVGLLIGFFVCFITVIQIIKEYKSDAKSTLSIGYVMGWLLVYLFWALYGLRFQALALGITNSLAFIIQIVLCIIIFKKRKI